MTVTIDRTAKWVTECGRCHASLSGGRDTFGPVYAPLCARCYHDAVDQTAARIAEAKAAFEKAQGEADDALYEAHRAQREADEAEEEADAAAEKAADLKKVWEDLLAAQRAGAQRAGALSLWETAP